MSNDITVEELNKRLEAGEKIVLLDVREPFEHEMVNIEGILIPLGELPDRVHELEDYKEKEIIVYCRSGARSAEGVSILKKAGFQNPRNMTGGINTWAMKIDPSMPLY